MHVCLVYRAGQISLFMAQMLTHWGRATHICVSKLTIIGSDNGLSPGRRQAIIWTNAGILLIEPLGTNFNEILINIHTFSFKRMHLKLSSGKYRPSCLGLNVFNAYWNNHFCYQHYWLAIELKLKLTLIDEYQSCNKYTHHWSWKVLILSE